MGWFLFCAQKLASSSSSSSVAFYVASDSLKHVSAFTRGIAAVTASAPSGRRGKREWVVLTAEVLNNSTDSWTGDTFGDLMVVTVAVYYDYDYDYDYNYQCCDCCYY